MNKKTLLLAVIVVCLAALVYLSLAGPTSVPPPLPSSPRSGNKLPSGHPPLSGEEMIKAPDFTLDSLNQGRVSLSQYKGKVVIINFWSSGCPPCIMEMPSLDNLRKAMAGKPFEILTITSDPRSMAANTLKNLRVDLPVLFDPDGKVTMGYGAFETPTTFIIAPDGTVDNHVIGAANWADGSVVDYMNKLISSFAPKVQKG